MTTARPGYLGIRRLTAYALDCVVFVFVPWFLWVVCPIFDWERPGAVAGKRMALVAVALPLVFGVVEVWTRCRVSKRLMGLMVVEGSSEPSVETCARRVLAKWGWLALWSGTLCVAQIADLDRIPADDPRATAWAAWGMACVAATGTWLIIDGLAWLVNGVSLHDRVAGTSVVLEAEHRGCGFDVVQR